jgi:bifunctional non-homologous end joining protein LigD
MPPCQPTLSREPPTGSQWKHEVKFDGYRLQIHKIGREVALYSKNGADFTARFEGVTLLAKKLPVKRAVFDCELTAVADDGTPDFKALLHRRSSPLQVWVFDLLYEGTDLRDQSFERRRRKLERIIQKSDVLSIRLSETFDDPIALLRACVERGLEGIVSKRVDRPYRPGPSKDWLKTKSAAWREANRWRHEFFAKR